MDLSFDGPILLPKYEIRRPHYLMAIILDKIKQYKKKIRRTKVYIPTKSSSLCKINNLFYSWERDLKI